MLLPRDTGNPQSLFFSFSTNVTYIVASDYLLIVLLCAGQQVCFTRIRDTTYRPANLTAVEIPW